MLTKNTGKESSISKKGPRTYGVQEFQPRGDYGLNFRETIPYLNQEQLSQQLLNMHE